MVIESRTMVGAAGVFAIVGAVVWVSMSATSAPMHNGTVEVQQIEERSWAVEVKDLGADSSGIVKTAANR